MHDDESDLVIGMCVICRINACLHHYPKAGVMTFPCRFFSARFKWFVTQHTERVATLVLKTLFHVCSNTSICCALTIRSEVSLTCGQYTDYVRSVCV